MSDALTDIARDGRRSLRYEEYLERLYKYLQDNSEDNYKQLETIAEETDAVPRGYWNGPTSLQKRLEERVKKLKNEDKNEWMRLLWRITGFSKMYHKLKEISPFKGREIIFADYGKGFVTFELANLERKSAELLRRKDLKIYDCDKYALVIPIEDLLENAEVVWVSCYGQNSPRDQKGKSKI